MRRVDVAILGAGSAGLSALREVRKRAESFVVVNDGPWGTMCARVGCMPSKALVEAATAFHRRKALFEFGVRGSETLNVDAGAVLERVRAIRDALVADTCEVTARLGDRAISGPARLRGPNRVVVGDEEIEAKRIVIATGSRPTVPAKWRSLAARLLTTDQLFEEKTLPRRLAVIGLGPLGAELAQALARLGCEVSAFESKTRVAGLEDQSISDALTERLREDLAVHLGHEVELTAEGDAVRVCAGDDAVVVDRVLVALGRMPNLDQIGLETLGVALDEGGKPEFDRGTMQIGRLPVFLAGDASGDRPRQHEAADEGHIAGFNACSETVMRYRRRVPLAIVFTDPNVAIVGRSGADLGKTKVVSGQASFAEQGRSRLGLRGPGKLQIRADRETGAIVGAELCAPGGEHIAHLLALAIAGQFTVKQMLAAPFYHPTLEEGVRGALREVADALGGTDGLELEKG